MATKTTKPAPEFVSVDFDGHTYEIPVENWDNVDFVAALEQEKHVTAMQLLLGDTYQTFKTNHKVRGRLPMTIFAEFIEAVGEAAKEQTATGN